ncbi:hypothetical protein J4462_04935 [Candidatus Pacearchaeota archaeon]|nr:hypothetical protein [Candidatus Pacearchaeota archaeon]
MIGGKMAGKSKMKSEVEGKKLAGTRLTQDDEKVFTNVLRTEGFNPNFKHLKKEEYAIFENALYEVIRQRGAVWYADFVMPFGSYVRELYSADPTKQVILYSDSRAGVRKSELFDEYLESERSVVNRMLDLVKKGSKKPIEDVKFEDVSSKFDYHARDYYQKIFFELQTAIRNGKTIEGFIEESAKTESDAKFNGLMDVHIRRPLEHLMRRASKFSVSTPLYFFRKKHLTGEFDSLSSNVVQRREFEEENRELQQLYKETIFGREMEFSGHFFDYAPLRGIFDQCLMAYTSEETAMQFMERIFSFHVCVGKRIGLTVDYVDQLKPISIGKEELCSKPVADLDFSVRARKTLQRLSVTTISELVNLTEENLLSIRGFGQKSLMEVRKRLNDLGLKLRDN